MRCWGFLLAGLLTKEGSSAFCSSRSIGIPRYGSSHLPAKKESSKPKSSQKAQRAKAAKTARPGNGQSKLAKAAKSPVEVASPKAAEVNKLSESQKQTAAKIDALNEEVAIMKRDIRSVKTLLEKERRDKRIERAMTLTDLDSFEYYDDFYIRRESDELAKAALRWFLLDYAFVLPPDATLTNVGSYADEDVKEAARREFRAKFKKQIKNLIQRQPRMVNDPDDEWIIAYD